MILIPPGMRLVIGRSIKFCVFAFCVLCLEDIAFASTVMLVFVVFSVFDSSSFRPLKMEEQAKPHTTPSPRQLG